MKTTGIALIVKLTTVAMLSLVVAAAAAAATGSGPWVAAQKIDEIDGTEQLFFSRSSGSVPGDIFVSADFGPASPVTELNSPDNDIQPNVRKDGREIVFSSNHAYPGAMGTSQDIYISTRASTDDQWSAPINAGDGVNTMAGETRPSLSWDAKTLLFARTPRPEGMSDVYVSAR
jgi:Tol biopolymer transport system component